MKVEGTVNNTAKKAVLQVVNFTGLFQLVNKLQKTCQQLCVYMLIIQIHHNSYSN